MKFTIENKDRAKAFSSMFQNIKLFADHINLMFEPHRLYAQGMDSSHISIFEIIIPNTWFDSYWQEGNDVIGVNTVLFHKILGTREDNQTIEVVYDRAENSDQLFVHFAGTKSFDKHFELPLVELESDLMEIPDVDYQAEFALASSNFASLVGQLKQFGSDLFIKCNEEELRLTSKSNESGNMSVVVPIDDLSLFAINEGETINMSFSLVHLHNICAFHKVCENVNIKISEDYPLKTTYLLEPCGDDDDESTKAQIVVFLAPRISDDE